MTGPKITLYVDAVSPFAWIGFYLLTTAQTFKQCDITIKPVFLGGIMKETGNRPPLSVKSKAIWIEQERKRWATIFSVPVCASAPDNFPVNTISIQRALTAVARDHPHKLLDATTACFHGVWVQRNEGNVTGDGLGNVLAGVLGQDAALQVLREAKTDDVKQRLNKTTAEAIGEGAFGLPYFVATDSKGHKEAYWGVDHMGMMIDFLGLDRSKLGGRYQAML